MSCKIMRVLPSRVFLHLSTGIQNKHSWKHYKQCFGSALVSVWIRLEQDPAFHLNANPDTPDPDPKRKVMGIIADPDPLWAK